MSAADNAEVVRRGYAAFQTGDMEALRALFSPDIRWHVNGRNPQAGTFEGVDAVLGAFALLAADSGGTFRVELHDVLASDDHVVVLGRGSADRGGRHLEGNYAHVFHVSGGRVTAAWVLNEDPYAQDELWA
jgi:uncharacterized protein